MYCANFFIKRTETKCQSYGIFYLEKPTEQRFRREKSTGIFQKITFAYMLFTDADELRSPLSRAALTTVY
jgi:peptide methionine sulfoxide reductase MsrB